MNRWLLGGLVGVCAGAGAYLMVSMKEAPLSNGNVLEPPTVAALPPPSPPVPVVLTHVVEMTDLNPLLDPPEKPITGAPFDADAMPTPASTPVGPPVPDRIPPAVEDLPKGSEIFIYGYKLGTNALNDSNIHSVFVHDIANRKLETTPFRGFEVTAGAEVIRQIGITTPFHVVSNLAKADTELICTIVSIQKNILNPTQDMGREGELVVSADVVWRDLRNGKILSVSKKPRDTGAIPVSTLEDLSRADQSPKRQAEKANTPRVDPVRIVASGRLCMELGETWVTAWERAEIDLATQIAVMMEK